MRITLLGVLALLGVGVLAIYLVHELQRWADRTKVQNDEPTKLHHITHDGTTES